MSLPTFTALCRVLGNPKVIWGQNPPKLSTFEPIVRGDEEMFERFCVIKCAENKLMLELKKEELLDEQEIWMFGLKCERTYFDNPLFNEELVCLQGYRVYVTNVWEFVDEKRIRAQSEGIPIKITTTIPRTQSAPVEMRPREFRVTQKVLEPIAKPKGEVIYLHLRHLKPGTSEWIVQKYSFKFVK